MWLKCSPPPSTLSPAVVSAHQVTNQLLTFSHHSCTRPLESIWPMMDGRSVANEANKKDVEGWCFIVGDNKQTIINPLIINGRSRCCASIPLQRVRPSNVNRRSLTKLNGVVVGRVELLVPALLDSTYVRYNGDSPKKCRTINHPLNDRK